MRQISAKYSQFVMPDHINVVGTLFGGQMIAWVDLAAAKASHRLIKGTNVDGSVTVSYTHLTLPTIYSV